ncbi:MAG: phage terminase small subunit P27 family [Planctomycetota bacterium]
MTRGRKPKPTRLKALAGNPGKRPVKQDEPKPAAGRLSCPAHVKGAAATEWRRIVKILDPLKIVTQADRAALAAYCVTYGRWVEAEKDLRETGVIVKSPSGYPIQNPYLAVANKALQQMRQYLAEFGLTPSSRSRMATPPPSDETADELEF